VKPGFLDLARDDKVSGIPFQEFSLWQSFYRVSASKRWVERPGFDRFKSPAFEGKLFG
jgi:hypothetical protein